MRSITNSTKKHESGKRRTSLNLKLESSLIEQLEERCAEEERTKTAVVERALREYFKSQE